MPRRCDVHKEDFLLILLTQLGVSLIPHLTDITLDVVIVYHTQTVQTAMLLTAPAAPLRGFLVSLLVHKHLIPFFIGGNENHKRQLLLLSVIGSLVALFQSLTGLFYQAGSLGR